ncbi:SUKH-4 family immunity protein [Streptomyces vinaceus]|uniref:SUKH-4 family immunity protein n=1 Tax=Streptomyces vinaceus TaxID=1960 RepID=UPI0038262E44
MGSQYPPRRGEPSGRPGAKRARGYDGDGGRQYERVNSSVAGLQNVLATWEAFVCSGKSDGDDDYEDYVEDVTERARQSDPRVFEDEESWWSRVFEEVELGLLAPEDPEPMTS